MTVGYLSWTDDRLDRLCAMWRAGKSGGEIAAELGCSRNAVIARVGRLRAAGDPRVPAEMRAPTVPVLAPIDRVAEAMANGASSVAQAGRDAKLTQGQAQHLWAKIRAGLGSQAA